MISRGIYWYMYLVAELGLICVRISIMLGLVNGCAQLCWYIWWWDMLRLIGSKLLWHILTISHIRNLLSELFSISDLFNTVSKNIAPLVWYCVIAILQIFWAVSEVMASLAQTEAIAAHSPAHTASHWPNIWLSMSDLQNVNSEMTFVDIWQEAADDTVSEGKMSKHN